ncbi:unnamed protein product [Nesidiocoris tenuis]|uniref:Uncharacterized protein n=1 Tax=Nesidiocoris tenuis TaxID=355587 RepID=A0A6H5GK44_9HEMI|nr:unnamed protein product [Nesidiocoris tenuis]
MRFKSESSASVNWPFRVVIISARFFTSCTRLKSQRIFHFIYFFVERVEQFEGWILDQVPTLSLREAGHARDNFGYRARSQRLERRITLLFYFAGLTRIAQCPLCSLRGVAAANCRAWIARLSSPCPALEGRSGDPVLFSRIPRSSGRPVEQISAILSQTLRGIQTSIEAIVLSYYRIIDDTGIGTTEVAYSAGNLVAEGLNRVVVELVLSFTPSDSNWWASNLSDQSDSRRSLMALFRSNCSSIWTNVLSIKLETSRTRAHSCKSRIPSDLRIHGDFIWEDFGFLNFTYFDKLHFNFVLLQVESFPERSS